MVLQKRLELIARLMGLKDVTALAVEAGIKPGTAQKHKERGQMPDARAEQYIRAAADCGVKVDFEWLQTGRGPEPTPPPPGFVRKVPKLPPSEMDFFDSSANKDSALRLPLWQISVTTRGVERVLALVESKDKVLAIDALRDFSEAFAVAVWDSSNGPYFPRGTILFVERPYGGSINQLCLFAESHTEKELIRPAWGLLQGELNGKWIVGQHISVIELDQAEYPICWRIKFINRG